MKTGLKKNALAILCALGLGSIPLAFGDSFTANLTTVTPGDTLELTYQADQAFAQDTYLATVLNGTLLFVNEQGGVVPYQSGTPTPARLRSPAAGSHKLLSFTMPEGFYTNLTLYVALGRPGSDVLAGGNYDPASLRSLNVNFIAKQQPVTSTGARGRTLYTDHCSSCHGANPSQNISGISKGANSQAILAAIQKNSGGMSYLSTLASEEVTSIAQWIANPI